MVTANLVTAGATSYVVHRLATLARGAQPDDETVATWAVQGATLVLARLVHTRLDAVMERLKRAGARAGELVARAARQQARTLTYQSVEAIERGSAIQLVIEHQQLSQDEIGFWRQVAADPAALRTLGIDGEKAAARLAAAEGQAAELTGPAFQYLPLRLAGLEQEVEGSRLWVGDTEQIAEGLANAKAARLPLTVTPPPYPSGAGVPAARVWRITLGGEVLEIRERARGGDASNAAVEHDARTNERNADETSAPRRREQELGTTVRSDVSPASTDSAAAGIKQPQANARIHDPVPGLYDSIDPNVTPPGWRIVDREAGPAPHPDHPTWIHLVEDVIAPDGSTGWIQRAYDPETMTVVMENAFLEKLPRWVHIGTPLRPDKGTPTVAYLTLRQMKRFEIQFGEVETVKMSTIQNVEAVMQLEQMHRSGIPREKAVAKTHSVDYTTTSIEQSGHSIVNVAIDVSKAWRWRLGDMMDHFRVPRDRRAKLFAEYNLGPDDKVLVNYDIMIKLAHHPMAPKAGRP